jgi:hypothetical protein
VSADNIHTETSAAWPLPFELTQAIALELAKPQMEDGVSPDLNTFRLVCKAFDTVGKRAWVVLAKAYPKCGYTTLCLPPKAKSLEDLAEIFLANGGILGKLVTNVRLSVLPSTNAEFVNFGVGIGHWDSARQLPLHHSASEQVHRRVITVEQLMIDLGMSSNQMDFLRDAITPARQAMLELVLDKIPNAVSFEVLTPLHKARAVKLPYQFEWMDDYDYAGCCELMSSLSFRCKFADMTLDLGLDVELDDPWPLSLFVTKTTSMHIRTSEGFFERDTIVKALTRAKELTTLSVCMERLHPFDSLQSDILTDVPVLSKLKAFCLTGFLVTHHLIHFLNAHRASLDAVRLRGYTEHEDMILDLVRFMRSKLKPQECHLEIDEMELTETGANPTNPFGLRDLLRSLGDAPVIDDSEPLRDGHCALLSKYVLGS